MCYDKNNQNGKKIKKCRNGGESLKYKALTEKVVEKLPDESVFTRKDLLEAVMVLEEDFKESMLRNLLEKLLKEECIIRVGRNQYQKKTQNMKKELYQNQYSAEAQVIVNKLQQEYPLLDYRVWEVNWLNEFWNHQISQNKIIIEVERAGCDFVYTELRETYAGNILLRPNEKELYRYGGHDTIIVDRLVSEAPKGREEYYNTPLEKVIVDLFANKNLRSMVHIGEYAKAIAEMFDKYYIDQVKLFRYADRRNKKEEICRFLKEEAGVKVTTEE